MGSTGSEKYRRNRGGHSYPVTCLPPCSRWFEFILLRFLSRISFMPLFQYKGRNQRGEAVRGHLEAVSSDAVAAQLMNSGVIPIDIGVAEAREDVLGALKAWLAASTPITLTDLSLFSRQMYTLLKAGVPIMQALRGLRDSTQNPALAKVIISIGERLDKWLDLTRDLRG